MRYFPINLDLYGRAVLVVGGGKVAEGKVRNLLEAHSAITVVSPSVTEGLQELETSGRIQVRLRSFQPDDLEGFPVVFGATNDGSVNRSIYDLASSRMMLCNVVDQPELCNFLTPSLLLRGDIQISVSTGGKSPTIGQLIRQRISELIGTEYEELLSISAELRARAKELLPDYDSRRDFLREFALSEALELIRSGHPDKARELGFHLLSAHHRRHSG